MAWEYVPNLVGVHHEFAVPADFFADYCGTADVIGEVAADFNFQMVPAAGDGFTAEATEFVIGIAEPAGGSGVGG